MPRKNLLTLKAILRRLADAGFIIDHASGGHYILRHPETKARVVVPHHRGDLPKGTAHAILKSAGL